MAVRLAPLQGSLFDQRPTDSCVEARPQRRCGSTGTTEVSPDASATTDPGHPAQRQQLDELTWVEHVPEWFPDGEALMAELARTMAWEQPERSMYQQRVIQPRLSATLPAGDPALPEQLRSAIDSLGERYDEAFASMGANLYRNGQDGVAWHGDRDGDRFVKTTIVIISLGERRSLRMRPVAGGPSRSWELGRGDVFAMGGAAQRDWQHGVPKRARAGPRMSLVLRTRGVR